MARKLTTFVIAVALLGAAASPAASAATKVKGKVTACVIKKGKDKGLMRFAPKGKCKKGEKKLTWNKRGKRGKRGKAGPAGPEGPAGPAGGSAGIQQLEQTVAALCTQLSTVTSQLTAVQTAVAGLGLNSAVTTIIPAAAITIPGMPAPLGSFGCP